jgi:sugar transferase (PEP-CTERM system associated)
MSLAVEEIIVARDNQRGMPIGDLLACRTIGIRVREYISFLEEEIGYIDVDELRPSALIFSWGFDRTPIFLATKRLFDIGVSLFLLVFTLPLTILAAIAIRLDSPGPILFRQDRVGLDSRRFQVLKFRSMRVDAEREGPQWAALKDARVTRIGAMLRKTRIDEIPQLINVLKGDMSFVGPRPERPFFVDSLRTAIPFYDERHKMKPGLTGWAQIHYPYGASVEDAKEKLAYDLYYAKSASMILDVLIALQTIRVVLFPRGVR